MKVLRQIGSRNQVVLPRNVLKRAGIAPGDYVEIINKNGIVILRPKDDEFTKEEIDKLDKFVKREIKAGRYTEYKNAEEFLKHLEKL